VLLCWGAMLDGSSVCVMVEDIDEKSLGMILVIVGRRAFCLCSPD
jgi:hypothetical protein